MATEGPSNFDQSIVKDKIEPKVEKNEYFEEEMSVDLPSQFNQLKVKVQIEPKEEKTEAVDEEMCGDQFKLEFDSVVEKIVVMKRWLNVESYKSVVKGTPFVPFKMPFIGTAIQPCPPEKRFDISELLKAFPNIGLIVDLSNYRRTYHISDLLTFGIQYVNIPVKFERQNSVPSDELLNLFIDNCSSYATNNPGKLIGVHDQLGNRATAYMICKALEKQRLSMDEAMKSFQSARGCPIYAALAGVMNGSRTAWIPQSEFKPDMKILSANKQRTSKIKKKTNCKSAKSGTNKWQQRQQQRKQRKEKRKQKRNQQQRLCKHADGADRQQ